MVAFVYEFRDYALGDFSVVGCFEEFTVRRTFAFGLDAVAVVDQGFHGAVGDSSGIPWEMPGRAGHDVTKVMKSCRERNYRER